MIKRYSIRALLFFCPIVILYIGIEAATRSVPTTIKKISEYLTLNQGELKTVILGASQHQGAIYPEKLTSKAINLASGHQDLRTDYLILKKTHKRLPKLKTVIISLTYRHLETKPNSKRYWKNAGYLYYYGVNAYGRNTYFKDKLLFLSNPDFYSKQLKKYYIDKNLSDFAKSGFQKDSGKEKFDILNYDSDKIKNSDVAIQTLSDLESLKTNTKYLTKIVEYCEENNLQLVITHTPTYKTYKLLRNKNIVRRRDSVLEILIKKNPSIKLLDQESTNDYSITEYRNENHLNNKGAIKFTKRLDKMIEL